MAEADVPKNMVGVEYSGLEPNTTVPPLQRVRGRTGVGWLLVKKQGLGFSLTLCYISVFQHVFTCLKVCEILVQSSESLGSRGLWKQ